MNEIKFDTSNVTRSSAITSTKA